MLDLIICNGAHYILKPFTSNETHETAPSNVIFTFYYSVRTRDKAELDSPSHLK